MKKVNNKGVTLIELIVSFAIVGVALIYFFQTLYTVKNIYKTTQEETNKFVAKDYALRIMEKCLNYDSTFFTDTIKYSTNSNNTFTNDETFKNYYFMVDYDNTSDICKTNNFVQKNSCEGKKSVIVPYYKYYNYDIYKYNVLVCY